MSPAEKEQSTAPGWTITISRQLGSLGMEVAQAAANLIGYRCIRQEFIREAARRAGSPEMMLAFIDDLGLLDVCPAPETCLAFRTAIAEIMHEYASIGGVVIVGRAGQVILKDHPRALHARVVASQSTRIERIAAMQGIHAKAALAQIEASDRNRRTYLRRFYDVRWGDPSLYHLVINTTRFTPEQAARLIQAALQELAGAVSIPKNGRSIS